MKTNKKQKLSKSFRKYWRYAFAGFLLLYVVSLFFQDNHPTEDQPSDVELLQQVDKISEIDSILNSIQDSLKTYQ